MRISFKRLTLAIASVGLTTLLREPQQRLRR